MHFNHHSAGSSQPVVHLSAQDGRCRSVLLTLMLFLAALTVQAQESTEKVLTGEGTQASPYLIKTLADYNTFADSVNSGKWSAACATLAANIDSVKVMIGTEQHRYSGTFDGAYHTLTVAITGSGQYLSPFRFVENATVKNLLVAGSVHQQGSGNDMFHTSGLLGATYGATISRVISSVNISFDNSGDGHAGGLIGHGMNKATTISDCAFIGSVSQKKGSSNDENQSFGGLIGWCDHGGNFQVTNSYVDIRLTNIFGQNNFVRSNTFDENLSHFTNCYYTLPDGVKDWDPEKNTVLVTADQMKSGYVADLLQNAHIDSMVWGQILTGDSANATPVLTTDSAKRVYKVTYTFNNKDIYTAYGHEGDTIALPADYAKSSITLPAYLKPAGSDALAVTIGTADTTQSAGDSLVLALPTSERYTVTATLGGKPITSGDTITAAGDLVFHFKAASGYSLCSADSMVMRKANATEYAAFAEPATLAVDEHGVFHLATVTDWNTFAQYCTTGDYVMDADIKTVTTMAGYNDNAPFMGTFDGRGHTLDVNIAGTDHPAPFHNTKGATISNLRVTGTIGANGNSCKYAGGLVGSGTGGSLTITGCEVAATINSQTNGDGTHAGFVAVNANAKITNCLFSGAINGGNTHSCGGFMGWATNTTSSVDNSLNVGSFGVRADGGAATFIRANGSLPITHSYYKTPYGAAQGTQASADQLTSGALAWELQHYADSALNDTAAVAWGQTLGGDTADANPVPTVNTAKRVYRARFVVNGNVVFTSYANTGKPFTVPTAAQLEVDSLKIDYKPTPADNDTTIVITALNQFKVPTGEHYTVKVTRGGEELSDGTSVNMTDDLTYTVTAAEGYRLLTDTAFTLKGNEPFPAPAVLPVDEKNFLTIGTRAEWDVLARNYNSAYSYALTADIDSVTTMVGSAAKPFTGTFDGRGHTLTLAYDLANKADADQTYVGAFRFVSGATITNLRTAGYVKTNKGTNDVGGLIGQVTATTGEATTLANCESTVENTFGAGGDATNGGLIGRVTNNATVTIENCAFKGKITATNGGNSFGGFIGYVDDGAKAAYIKNCLMGATLSVGKAGNAAYGNAPFARRAPATAGKLHVTNSYYLSQDAFQLFDGQGTAETQDSLHAGAAAHHLQAAQEASKGQVWGQNLTGDSKDALPVLSTADSLRVVQATFSDTHNGKKYYTYANPGQTFPVPTAQQVGVDTVKTSYKDELARIDTTFTINAYNDILQLKLPVSDRYAVTVTREGQQLEDGAEILDTDVLTYTVTAKSGFCLLSDSSVTISGKDTIATPATLAEKDGYALIGSADDWTLMGKYCVNRSYRLTADIDVTTIVGSKTKPFMGTFDGQRHTIKVNYDMAGTDDLAPFSIIKDATIKNLTVRGDIKAYVPAGDASGLVGEANGTVSIENVASSVLLYWSKTTGNADITGSGLVGRVNDNCHITINNCLFNGAIIANDGNSVAGFIGWAHGNNVSVDIKNSLVAGSFEVQKANNGSGNETFARRDRNARLTITNSYYNPFDKQEFTDQGIAAGDSLLRTGTVAYLLQGKQDSLLWGQDIDERTAFGDSKPVLTNEAAKHVYRVSYGLGKDILYSVYGNTNDEVSLPSTKDSAEFAKLNLPAYIVPANISEKSVTVAKSDSIVGIGDSLMLHLPKSDNYTVTATLGDKTIADGEALSGEGNLVFHVAPKEGYKLFSQADQVMKTVGTDGFADFTEPLIMAADKDGYYTISNREEWDGFAASGIQEGNFRLTADIDSITTMVGQTAQQAFKGLFDGQGHTLTVNYDLRGEQRVAPFRYADGATFKNLSIKGAIKSDQMFTGGFVGEIINHPVTFTDCRSTVDMQWQGGESQDMTWGGFVGVSRAGATFSNCLFDGQLGDYTSRRNMYNRAFCTGGFLGWTDTDVNIRNSLVAAQMQTTWQYDARSSYTNATFGRSAGNGNRVHVDNCYYLRDGFHDFHWERCFQQGTSLNSKDDAQVKNGQLAFTLQGNDSIQHWGQNLETDKWPVLCTEPAKHIFKNVYDGEATANAAYANAFSIDETKGNKANIAANAAARGNVKLNRTFAEGWNTLVLPFSLTTEEVDSAFGKDTKVAYFSNDTTNVIAMNTSDTTKAIAANVPVLIQPGNMETTVYTFTDKTIEQKDSVETIGEMQISLIGSYNAKLTVPAGDYFISGDSLWQSQGKTTVQATRAFFHAPVTAGAKIRLVIDGDDVVTAIDGVAINGDTTMGNGAVYTLSGQKVAESLEAARKLHLTQGVYIVNGKKIVIK